MTELTNIQMHGGTYNSFDALSVAQEIKNRCDRERFDVTAWGDDGCRDKPWQPTDKLYYSIPFARITINAAKLIDVFDEAMRLGAVIVWGKNMPLDGVHGCPKGLRGLKEIVDRIQDTWHKQPPYIEVVGESHGDVYSIKPVWELTP